MYIENIVIDAIRIISVLNAYYRHITKIMRIACVLKAYCSCGEYNVIKRNIDSILQQDGEPERDKEDVR